MVPFSSRLLPSLPCPVSFSCPILLLSLLSALLLAAPAHCVPFNTRAVLRDPLHPSMHGPRANPLEVVHPSTPSLGADADALGNLTALSHGPHVHPMSAWAASLPHLSVAPLPRVTLSTNCTTFDFAAASAGGLWCNVSWSGVLYPAADDLLALYVPPTVDPRSTVPVQVARAAASPLHLTSGEGWSIFHLINMRQSMGFKFVKHGFVKPLIIGSAPVITNTAPNYPSQGHLAVHQDGRSMVVQWVSGSGTGQKVQYKFQQQAQHSQRRSATNGGVASVAPVSGSTASGAAGSTTGRSVGVSAIGSTASDSTSGSTVGSVAGDTSARAAAEYRYVPSSHRTYTREDMCGFPASTIGWLDPGHIHTAIIDLQDLEPNQQVQYRYGSEDVGWSSWRSFLVPPRPGAPSDPALKFLVFNDVAMSNSLLFNNHCPPYCPPGLHFNAEYGANSTKLPPYLEKEKDAHLALMIGDLSYAIGYAADWDFFGSQFESAFTQWPLATGMGNHERDWPGTGDAFQDTASDSGGECGIPAALRFYTPALERWDSSSSSSKGNGESSNGKGNGDSSSVEGSRDSSGKGNGNGGNGDGSSSSSRGDRESSGSGGSSGPSHHSQYITSFAATAKTTGSSSSLPAHCYSFDRGAVHFLVLDSEMPTDLDSEQGRFVLADLSSVNRSLTPWVVVGLHRMMWAPCTWRSPWVGDLDNEERFQADLEDLFMQYQVDIVVQGHEHAYARTCHLYKGECVNRTQQPQQPQRQLQQRQQQQQQQAEAAIEAARDAAAPHMPELQTRRALAQPKAAVLRSHSQVVGGKTAEAETAEAETAEAALVETAVVEAATALGRAGGSGASQGPEGLTGGGAGNAGAAGKKGQATDNKAQRAGDKAQRAGMPDRRLEMQGTDMRIQETGAYQAPVYVLSGHAGAGFTHGFPKQLPPWVVTGFENRNGYTRFTVTHTTLLMEAVSTDDGSIMDTLKLSKKMGRRR